MLPPPDYAAISVTVIADGTALRDPLMERGKITMRSVNVLKI